MKNLFAAGLFILSGAGQLFAQNNILTMQISEIMVQKKDTESEGMSKSVPLVLNKTTDRVSLYDDAETKIFAAYKLVSYNSPRSQNKNSGIKVKIEYTCTHKGKTISNKKEKMFFLTDSRTFEEKEKLVFTDKVKNETISLKYKGLIEE